MAGRAPLIVAFVLALAATGCAPAIIGVVLATSGGGGGGSGGPPATGGGGPAAPSRLTATIIDQTRVDLTWTDNTSDETAFAVQRRPLGATDFGDLAFPGPNSEAYSDTGLTAGNGYEYRIIVITPRGQAASRVVAVTTPTVPPPAAPTLLAASAVSPTRVDLTWTDNASDETEFLVERRVSGAFDFANLTTLPANTQAHMDNAAAPSTSYDYRVIAVGPGGRSVSNVAVATTPALPPPAAPTSLTATAISPTRVDLSWTDNASDETQYSVDRRVTGAPTFTNLTNIAANSQTHSDTTAAAGTSYEYRVVAVGPGGQSPSNVATVTTPAAAPPAAPTLRVPTVVDANRVDLSWIDASNNETGFRLERRPAGVGSFATLGTAIAGATSFIDSTVAPEQRLDYRVFAFNSGGDSTASNVRTVETVPAVPTGLAATQTGGDEVSLTWVDGSALETTFEIDRAPAGGVFALVGTVPGNRRAFVDPAAPPASALEYRVRAVSASGSSSPSNVAAITLPATGPRLLGLSRRFALEAGGGSVTLTGRYFAQPGAGATTVSFGTQAAGTVSVVDDTTITCVIPAADASAGPFADVKVTNALGSSTLPVAFTYATALLEADFTSTTLPVWLEDASGTHAISGGVIRETAAFDGNRCYVRTTSADWLARDFVYEVTLNVSSDAGVAIMFPGIGSGEPDGSFSNEPRESFYFRCHPPTILFGHVPVAAHSTGSFVFTDYEVIGHQRAFGTRRVRVTKVGQRATFAFDREWAPGDAFQADHVMVVEDLAASAPFLTGTNTRLFFGGATPACSYDDVVAATLRTTVVRVDAVSPDRGDVGATQAVTITGDGFQGGGTPTVTLGDASGPAATGVSVTSDDSLDCTTPTGPPGRTDVLVSHTIGAGVALVAYRYHRAYFSASFEGTNLEPDVEGPTGAFPVAGGSATPSGNGREYARTFDGDYHGRDFVYEVEVNASGSDIIFVGIGTGEPDPANSNEPRASVHFRLHTPGLAGGNVDVAVTGAGGSGTTPNVGAITTPGRHLVRLTRRGNRLDLQIDAHWTGVGFTADIAHAILDLAASAPFLTAGESHLFFGAANGVQRFDAVRVSP